MNEEQLREIEQDTSHGMHWRATAKQLVTEVRRLQKKRDALLEACKAALEIALALDGFHDGAEGTDAKFLLEDAIAKADGKP